MSQLKQFLGLVEEEAVRASELHPPHHSYHEAHGIIAEELDEFWDIVRMKGHLRNSRDALGELVQVAAAAAKAAVSLGLTRHLPTG
jgi:hypothetical protein